MSNEEELHKVILEWDEPNKLLIPVLEGFIAFLIKMHPEVEIREVYYVK